MQKLTVVLLAGALSGCATYNDLKQGDPVVTRTVMGNPAALADCYIDKRMADHVENFQKLELSGTLHLVVRDVPMWGTPSLLYELSFTPIDPGKTKVDLREAMPTLDLGHSREHIAQTVNSCGGFRPAS